MKSIEGFDEPRVITRVDAVMTSGEVSHWKASIAPKPRRKPSEASEHPTLAPHPDDPVGENPCPKDHPAHGIWEAATQEALEELFSYKQTMLGRAPKDPAELFHWRIEYAFRVYQIWAKRNLSIVRNQPGLRGYEQWLDNFLESSIRDMPKDIAGVEPLLRLRLLQAANYWKANGYKNVREFQSGSLDQSISEVPQPSLNEEPLSNKDETTIPLRTSINSRCDFSSEAGRNDALMSYTVHWTCSEASLARTARVDPADLSKWKRGNLPNESDKKNRIESAIEKNERPSPLPARPNY